MRRPDPAAPAAGAARCKAPPRGRARRAQNRGAAATPAAPARYVIMATICFLFSALGLVLTYCACYHCKAVRPRARPRRAGAGRARSRPPGSPGPPRAPAPPRAPPRARDAPHRAGPPQFTPANPECGPVPCLEFACPEKKSDEKV